MEAAVISIIKRGQVIGVFQRKKHQDSATEYRKRSRPEVMNTEAWIQAMRAEQ